ncbi:MAG: hypothetical protein H8Z69_03715 [Nanohaloarchaea archaeon]|nr:hypothetical protein [Candidatus Nanohaloarchaea archaeon]
MGSRIFELADKKIEWLRAFIRDEGHYEPQYNRLRVKSMNRRGLEGVRKLLNELDVEANTTGPNCDDSHYLTISGVDDYPDILRIAEKKPKVK